MEKARPFGTGPVPCFTGGSIATFRALRTGPPSGRRRLRRDLPLGLSPRPGARVRPVDHGRSLSGAGLPPLDLVPDADVVGLLEGEEPDDHGHKGDDDWIGKACLLYTSDA